MKKLWVILFHALTCKFGGSGSNIIPSSQCVPYISVGTDLLYSTTKEKRFFITFEPDEEVKKIEILVPDDDIVEATENHIIKLRVPDGETRVNLLQDQANVTVVDNDSE